VVGFAAKRRKKIYPKFRIFSKKNVRILFARGKCENFRENSLQFVSRTNSEFKEKCKILQKFINKKNVREIFLCFAFFASFIFAKKGKISLKKFAK